MAEQFLLVKIIYCWIFHKLRLEKENPHKKKVAVGNEKQFLIFYPVNCILINTWRNVYFQRGNIVYFQRGNIIYFKRGNIIYFKRGNIVYFQSGNIIYFKRGNIKFIISIFIIINGKCLWNDFIFQYLFSSMNRFQIMHTDVMYLFRIFIQSNNIAEW